MVWNFSSVTLVQSPSLIISRSPPRNLQVDKVSLPESSIFPLSHFFLDLLQAGLWLHCAREEFCYTSRSPNVIDSFSVLFVSCLLMILVLFTMFPFFLKFSYSSVQFSSVAQLCLTLCDPMHRSTPGPPVHHKLLEFTQTHAHWVGDAIQPSHPLSSPSPPAPNPSQHQGLFQWVNSLHKVAKVLEFHLQHQSFQWTPRTYLLQEGLVGSPYSPRDSQESSPAPQFKSINFSVLSFLHSPILRSLWYHALHIFLLATWLLFVQSFPLHIFLHLMINIQVFQGWVLVLFSSSNMLPKKHVHVLYFNCYSYTSYIKMYIYSLHFFFMF